MCLSLSQFSIVCLLGKVLIQPKSYKLKLLGMGSVKKHDIHFEPKFYKIELLRKLIV